MAARYVSHAQLRLQIIARASRKTAAPRYSRARQSCALYAQAKLAPARKRKRVARHFYKEMEFANATTEAQVAQQDKLLSFFETLRVTNEVAIDGIVEWLLADTPVAVVILVYGPVASGKTAFTRLIKDLLEERNTPGAATVYWAMCVVEGPPSFDLQTRLINNNVHHHVTSRPLYQPGGMNYPKSVINTDHVPFAPADVAAWYPWAAHVFRVQFPDAGTIDLGPVHRALADKVALAPLVSRLRKWPVRRRWAKVRAAVWARAISVYWMACTEHLYVPEAMDMDAELRSALGESVCR